MAPSNHKSSVHVGIAGWSIPARYRDKVPALGTHLARYAHVFNAVEINSSFYRPHRRPTYERWCATVPAGFRFAVKVPKVITHVKGLRGYQPDLAQFVNESSGLKEKLGALLVQLPPRLEFDAKVASAFFDDLRSSSKACVVCEPRHRSWFTSTARECFVRFGITGVNADPPIAGGSDILAGSAPGLFYHRLHGSPKIYYSSYDSEYLRALACQIAAESNTGEVWCIFDNTADHSAWDNALQLQPELKRQLGRAFVD
jgi:uncharacterized protein YecE (DUF72 family)